MKKLITLVLTLALCVPMFLTTSLEVKAEDENTQQAVSTTWKEIFSAINGEGDISINGITIGKFKKSVIWIYSNVVVEDFTNEEIRKAVKNEGTIKGGTFYETVENYSNITGGTFSGTVVNREEITGGEFGGYVNNHSYIREGKFNVEIDNRGYIIDGEFHGTVNNLYGEIVDGEFYGTVNNATGKITGGRFKYEPEGGSKSGYTLMDSNDGNQGSNTQQPSPTPDENAGGNSISKNENPYTPAPTEEEIAKWKADELENKIKAEEAIPVTDFISTAAVNGIPSEVKSNASTEVVYNVSQIAFIRGFAAAVDKIAKENVNEKTITIYSNSPFAFNTTSLTAIANTNKDFVYMFKHEGQLYGITIPAGANVDLEGQMFAGPLYIGAKFGTSAVIK